MSNKVYEEITKYVMDALDKDIVPWHKPWSGGVEGLPRNWRGTPYRGMNVWILWYEQFAKGYTSNVWLTLNQANKLGGRVRKGEKSTMVIIWKPFQKKNAETGKVEWHRYLNYYRVFNTEQCDGLPERAAVEVKELDPIAEAEAIIAGYESAPPVFYGGGRAYYVPATDEIHLPPKTAFESAEGLYATLFHEFVHSTGSENRVNRHWDRANMAFGCANYAREELVAEFGNAYLCGITGLPMTQADQSAAYIANWKQALTDDPTILISAAGAAQKAVDFILGKVWEKTESDEESPEETLAVAA